MSKPILQIYCQEHPKYVGNGAPRKCASCEFLYRLCIGDITISRLIVRQME